MPLSDEQLREIFERGADSARQGAGQIMPDPIAYGLRAVEAAVRADQIEKDARIADERHRKVQDEPALIAWRIRAQLSPSVRARLPLPGTLAYAQARAEADGSLDSDEDGYDGPVPVTPGGNK